MKFAHLATRLYNTPLLILPDKAIVIEAFFRARVEGRAVLEAPSLEVITKREQVDIELAAQGMQRADAGYWRTAAGVALIPVFGTLVHRGDSLDAMSGLTGYNRLAGQLQAAVDDVRVDAIMLEVDSPGGEVSGIVDFASKIAAAGKKKPTWALANESAFSAAYWLASAADKVYATQTSLVGSIGVYLMHQDQSQKDAKSGTTYTFIQAGARKTDFNSHAPLSDEARAVAQARVDEIYSLFVDTVAGNRGIDAQAVRDTEAGMLNTKAAQDVGLIDGVASFDETLAALSAEAQRFRMRGRVYSPAAASFIESTLETETTEMANEKTFTQADIDAARAAGKTEAEQATKDAAKAAADAASKASQERIAAIMGHDAAKGHEAMAKHWALHTNRSVDEVVADLKALPTEAVAPANPLAAAMADKRNANPKVGADVDKPDGTTPTISVTDIYARRREQAKAARH